MWKSLPDDAVFLDEILTPDCHWPHLRRLQLRGVFAYVRSLRTILNAHKATLRSLEIGDISLVDFDGEPQPWNSVFKFLNSSLKLEDVRFVGYLLSLDNEAWYACENVPAMPHTLQTTSCLKHRVEHFVIRGGRFPLAFPAAMPTTPRSWADSYRRLIGDSSWSFVPHMLHI